MSDTEDMKKWIDILENTSDREVLNEAPVQRGPQRIDPYTRATPVEFIEDMEHRLNKYVENNLMYCTGELDELITDMSKYSHLLDEELHRKEEFYKRVGTCHEYLKDIYKFLKKLDELKDK